MTIPLSVIGKREKEAAWLRKHGYDGLCAAGECACEVDDLYPCGERGDCQPGYKGYCSDACTHEGAGDGSWHISKQRPETVSEPTAKDSTR